MAQKENAMKKQMKKLALSTETIRQLQSADLHHAHGGAINQSLNTCPATLKTCYANGCLLGPTWHDCP
jgi:hypothetical protein